MGLTLGFIKHCSHLGKVNNSVRFYWKTLALVQRPGFGSWRKSLAPIGVNFLKRFEDL